MPAAPQALRGGGARKVQHVALRVAAADAVRHRRQCPQQRLRAGVVAPPERGERAAGRQPDEPRHVAVRAAVARDAPRLRVQQPVGAVPAPGGDERHHGVQVVERAVRIFRVRRPARRKNGKSLAGIDVGQMQPPEQRRGIDQLREPLALNAPVVDRQRVLRPAELQVVEREVPPQVGAGAAAAGPQGTALAHPAHALREAALHLEHVRDGMVGAQVARLQLERPARRRFRRGVLAALLQREGVHRKHRVVRRHGAHHLRGACAHRLRVAEEMVEDVRDRQREQLARALGEDLVVDSAGARKLAVEGGGDRSAVRPVEAIQILPHQSRVDPAGRFELPRAAAAQQQARLEQAPGYALGAARERQRIAAMAQELCERLLEGRPHCLRIGESAAPMRCSCTSVSMPPRISWKRASCTPEPMYCQR
jgi:hypothetical protein